MAFKIGDIVRLRSGSPLMTVVGISGSSRISCKWFVNNMNPEQCEFPSQALNLYVGPLPEEQEQAFACD